MNTESRFEQLDSLRGLASMSVVISHLVGIVPIFLFELLNKTPLHIIWAGHEAVILFFILSGFVLSLPYYKGKKTTYKHYIIKRVCRIYLPYLISILFSIFLIKLIPWVKIPELNRWFTGNIGIISSKKIIEHVLFLGDYDSTNFNFSIWSLVHEMRISIIFPILMYFVLLLNFKQNAMLCVLISSVSTIIGEKWSSLLKYDTSIVLTIKFIPFFILGALIAKYNQKLCNYYITSSKMIKLTIAVVGLILYTFEWCFFRFNYFILNEWTTALGASIFIILSLNSKIIKSILLFKPIHFIGKISYSLYLFHVILMMFIVNALHGKLPFKAILVAVVVASIIFASAAYYLIEKPAIKLGIRLTKLVTEKPRYRYKSKIIDNNGKSKENIWRRMAG